MKRKIAILGYETINIGDDIQSFVTSTLVKPDYVINRDNYEEIYDFKTGERISKLEEEVLLIMNGWFMHSGDKKLRMIDINFPFKNSLIKPLFISTCLAKEVPELLQEDKIEFYKKHPPFFCRDMYTKKNLDSLGVESNFFGCLTQLLSPEDVGENKEYQERFSDTTIYVDCLPKQTWSEEKIALSEHYIYDLMGKNPVLRLQAAKDLLQRYKYAKKIYTTRLHCFLPCRAMGLNVEYVGVVDWRTQDLVLKKPNVEKMKEIFYSNLQKLITIDE